MSKHEITALPDRLTAMGIKPVEPPSECSFVEKAGLEGPLKTAG